MKFAIMRSVVMLALALAVCGSTFADATTAHAAGWTIDPDGSP